MKKIYTAVLLLISFYSKAQMQQCGADEFNKRLNTNASVFAKIESVNSQLASYIINHPRASQGSGPLVVPVVFHVIHQNGPENVSDSVLQAELVALNQYFSNSGPYYQPNGVDVGIQFCLASVDPFGNPTTGITRDYSSHAIVDYLANPISDLQMKNVNRWNPYRYLNIWIVKQVINYANAYSSLPNSLGAGNDGIVIVGTDLGGIHYLITHEVGHYLGLNHHFVSGNCNNGNCLLDGDNICDTPPEMPNNVDCTISTCSTDTSDTTGFSPFTTDVNDMATIMSPKQGCVYLFTQGQADRMYASLTQIRHQLLVSNACGGNFGGTTPIASFTVSEFGCNATLLNYTGTPYEYIEWDTNNDGYFDTHTDSFGTVFNQSGYYTFTVRVFGSAGGDIDTHTVYIHARPNTNYPLQSTQGGVVPGGVCYGTTVTFTAVPGMASYLWSNGDTTQSTSYYADSSFYITLTCVDSTGYVWQRCPMPTVFYPVFPPMDIPLLYSLTPDSLCQSDTVAFTVQLNPGQTRNWWIINGFNSFSSVDTFTIFPPYTDNYHISMLITDSNYCTAYLDTLDIYVDPIPSNPYIPFYWNNTLYANSGPPWHHQFYLNGVAIPGADSSSYPITQPGCYSIFSYKQFPHCGVMSDTVCFWVVGDKKLTKVNDFNLYPNPVDVALTLTFEELLSDHDLSGLRLTNTLGETFAYRIIQKNNSSLVLDTRNLAQGMYQIQWHGISKKFIKYSH